MANFHRFTVQTVRLDVNLPGLDYELKNTLPRPEYSNHAACRNGFAFYFTGPVFRGVPPVDDSFEIASVSPYE